MRPRRPAPTRQLRPLTAGGAVVAVVGVTVLTAASGPIAAVYGGRAGELGLLAQPAVTLTNTTTAAPYSTTAGSVLPASTQPQPPAPVVDPVPVSFTTGLPDRRATTAIAAAMAQIGLPYVWGGDGPTEGDAGFDCSGLTHFAYDVAGIDLPRTAHTQYYEGPHVPATAGLQPGDLVYYGVPAKVHHVGMYIGNGKMVNAPTFGKPVQVAYYRWTGDDYLGATRPATSGAPDTGPLPVVPEPLPAPPAPEIFEAPVAPAPTEVPNPTVPEPPQSDTAALSIAQSATSPATSPDSSGAAAVAPGSSAAAPEAPAASSSVPGLASAVPGSSAVAAPSSQAPSGSAESAPPTSASTTSPTTTSSAPAAPPAAVVPTTPPPVTSQTPTPPPTTPAPLTSSAPPTSSATPVSSAPPAPSSSTTSASPARPKTVTLPGGTVTVTSARVSADGLPVPGGLAAINGRKVLRLATATPAEGASAGSAVTVTDTAGATTSFTVATSTAVTEARAAVRAAPAGSLVVLVPAAGGGWTVLVAA
ncbi:MAG: hypothetical protein JWP64_5789 [Pseudonocardia sp.]|uniref:NlpC/P60 family protein n=1 Tax=Pseudonocardia sp. TaxID=60912 RepID=UPI0034519D70|nr:hypothetical protein [Pseudonocardia sp.]